MFRIHHPLYVPIAPRDNHPACGREPREALDVGCMSASPHDPHFPQPFYCTRADGHDGKHQAAMTPGPHAHHARPLTIDAVLVIAEWDENRENDGLVL